MAKALIMVCVLALAGCGSFTRAMQMEKFEETARVYEGAIRWGHYELALGLLKEQDNAEPPLTVKALEKIKVITYESLAVRKIEEASRIEHVVKIKYYYIDELLERSLIDHQLWEYDSSDSWRLLSGLPAFN